MSYEPGSGLFPDHLDTPPVVFRGRLQETATASVPRLDESVAQARKLAGLGLAGAVGLARGRWIVAGMMLAVVGIAIGILIRDKDEVMLKLAGAPLDDEVVTPEERADIDAARSESAVPWDQALKDLSGRARSAKTT